MNAPLTFKFLLVGDGAVGKTSLVKRLCHNTYSDLSEETVGVEFMPHVINIDKQQIKLQIWDTAGQEQYKSLGRAYYRNAVGILLVFAYNDHFSFEHLETWINDVRDLCHPKAKILVVANKCDLIEDRRITNQEIEQFMQTYQLEWIESSAKLNTNVEQAFFKLAREVLNAVNLNEITLNTNANSNQATEINNTKKSEGCC